MADINSIGTRRLADLAGIKPEIARKIVNFRKQNNRLKTFEELYTLSGVTRAMIKRLRSKCIIGKVKFARARNCSSPSSCAKPTNGRSRTRTSTSHQQDIGVPPLRTSTQYLPAGGKDQGLKVYFPISVQSSPSGNKLTTVYKRVPEPTTRNAKGSVSSRHYSTSAQPPSSHISRTNKNFRKTSIQLNTLKTSGSPDAKRKSALSPNKEKSIRQWLSSVPVGLKQTNTIDAERRRRSRSQKSRSRRPNRVTGNQKTIKRIKTTFDKVNDTTRNGRHRNRIRTSNTVDRDHCRQAGQPKVTIGSPYQGRFSSGDSESNENLEDNPLTLDDLGNMQSSSHRLVNEPNAYEHGSRTVQRNDRRSDELPHSRHIDIVNHNTEPLNHKSESPYRHTVRRSVVQQSYSPVDGDFRERPRSSSARRTLWKGDEELEVTTRHRSHSPHARRHRHVTHHRDKEPYACVLL